MIENKIDAFLNLCNTTGAVKFEQDKYVLPDTFEREVKASGIPYDTLGDVIHLKLITYFHDCKVQYAETILGRLHEYAQSQSIILTSISGCCWYNPGDGTIFSKGTVDLEAARIFRNALAYFNFFDFLTQKQVSDYFNDANKEIVFYNSASGILKITFDPRPVIDFPGDITTDLKVLKELASYPQITSVFVNSIFQLTNGTGHIQLKSIISDRKKALDITKRDYELLAKKFDFEKFRNSLYKEKEKYFESIRDLVSKIFGQAVGIPVSIGASVFTSYKAEGNWFVIALLLAGFLVYLGYYLRLQFVYRSDINEVETQFNGDFIVIAAESGLPAATITEERRKVERRIFNIRSMQNWLIGMVIVLGVLASGFMVNQFFAKQDTTPDPIIKELTEAIKKYNVMADSIHDDLTGQGKDFYSPEHFTIEIPYNKNMYTANVVRVSMVRYPNEYHATLPTPDSILNKFPPVIYVVKGDSLVYNDSLKSIFPGFAELQKNVLMQEFKKKGWKL